MKIFLYSDLHISRTSSIMPMLSDSKYTYRQDMIKKTGEYLANVVDTEKPDLIINLGDTFDQHTITSYDIDVASEFFKCFRHFNIPHLVLVGNHEMINKDFNAIELLGNINNITVISEACTINTSLFTHNPNDLPIAILPYCDYKSILDFPEGVFLFSHNDIQGSSIRGNFTMPEGISPSILSEKYKLVFNGHIHKPSISGNVVNVGSISTHSFSDDDTSVPQCYIFDTDTLDLKTYKPSICPLFRKFKIETNINELQNYINSLDENYKYIVHISCPYELKEEVKQYLTGNNKILNSRLNVRVDKAEKQENNETINLQSNINIKQSFTDFLNTIELKYPKQLYLDVL